MDDVPPSYETAMTRDYWSIVANYIPSHDLCTAALVCRRWHEIFASQLWGDPASHFGTQNDMVYGKFPKKFRKRALLLLLTLNSCSNTVQTYTFMGEAVGQRTDTYPSPATSTHANVQWASLGLASRHS
jgi:hypothetical protein